MANILVCLARGRRRCSATRVYHTTLAAPALLGPCGASAYAVLPGARWTQREIYRFLSECPGAHVSALGDSLHLPVSTMSTSPPIATVVRPFQNRRDVPLAVIGTRRADRQNDFEDCPMRVTRRYREPTAVRFDNRSANCEAHSHAVGLGGEESIEDAIDISWREAGAGILDRNNHTLTAIK